MLDRYEHAHGAQQSDKRALVLAPAALQAAPPLAPRYGGGGGGGALARRRLGSEPQLREVSVANGDVLLALLLVVRQPRRGLLGGGRRDGAALGAAPLPAVAPPRSPPFLASMGSCESSVLKKIEVE